MNASQPSDDDLKEAVSQINSAAQAKKCWTCGCLHSSLKAIEEGIPAEKRSRDLSEATARAKSRLQSPLYDCLGCAICYPALAVNALKLEGDNCPSEPVVAREGWPPLPGVYQALRYQAPVAVCALTDEALMVKLGQSAEPNISIVGTLQTENLGIERLMTNVVANPYIRFLVVCGPDSRQIVGHLPGQSLVALSRQGLDERGYIAGAKGKRPALRNIPRDMVRHFRDTVEVIDLVNMHDIGRIVQVIQDCAARDPGPAKPFLQQPLIQPIQGQVPNHMVYDPAGYFVVFVDRARRILSLEHYQNDGVMDCLVEGRSPAELYMTAINKGLLTRLDHAAYLGRELARAHQALKAGERFIQDAAPERHPTPSEGCDCLG